MSRLMAGGPAHLRGAIHATDRAESCEGKPEEGSHTDPSHGEARSPSTSTRTSSGHGADRASRGIQIHGVAISRFRIPE